MSRSCYYVQSKVVAARSNECSQAARPDVRIGGERVDRPSDGTVQRLQACELHRRDYEKAGSGVERRSGRAGVLFVHIHSEVDQGDQKAGVSDLEAYHAALRLTTAFVVENKNAARFRLLGASFSLTRITTSSLKCAMRARLAAMISPIEAVESESSGPA